MYLNRDGTEQIVLSFRNYVNPYDLFEMKIIASTQDYVSSNIILTRFICFYLETVFFAIEMLKLII